MQRFKIGAVVVVRLCLLLVTVLISLSSIRAEAQGGKPPTDVNVTNTPSVNAQQSGAWNVAVVNPDSQAVPVKGELKSADEPWRTPWETRSQILPNAGGCYGVPTDCNNYSEGSGFALFDLRPVPEGKRWVVKSVTGVLANGISRTNNIELGYPRGFLLFDGTKWAFAGPFLPGVSFSCAVFSADLNVTFGPGETPFVKITATPDLTGYIVIVFSGYLIDAN